MKKGLCAAVFVATSLYLHFATYLMIYPDTRDYRNLSRSLSWQGIRPPLVPLFLKLSEDNHTIALWQLVIYLLASLALAFAAARWMTRAGDLAFGAMLGFALVPQHLLWCRSISSESLTFSELYVLLALTTVLCRPPRERMWQIVAGAGWLMSAALFIFTRDANGYLLVFLCGATVAACALLRDRRGLALSAAALALAAVLTSICAHQATAGGRWKWPFVNLLGQRVLWRPDRIAFFVERGMPVNPQVMCLANKWGADCNDDLSGFGGWLDGDIKGIYARYLLSHPIESLLSPFFHLDNTVLASDGHKGMFFYFHQPPAWYFWFGRIWFEWRVILIALIAAFVAGAWRVRRPLVPALVLLISVPPMLFFVWHADAAEPMRHAVVASSLLRLGLIFGILLAYDSKRA